MMFRALVFAVSMIAANAWAVDFEDVTPNLYAGGDGFVSGGYQVAVTSATPDVGLNGAIIDGSDPTACVIIDCSTGNASHYFTGLNDGGVEFSLSGQSPGFAAVSFDASFVAPVGGLGLTDPVARLRVYGFTAGTRDFLEATFTLPGASAEGRYSFASFSFAGTPLAGAVFSSVGMYACLIDGGRCDSPAGNQAQFALDNLVLAAVPEPSTFALSALGLLALVGRAPRRRLLDTRTV